MSRVDRHLYSIQFHLYSIQMKFKVQIKITMEIRLEILQSIDRSIGVFSQRGVGTAPRALGFSWTMMVETRQRSEDAAADGNGR